MRGTNDAYTPQHYLGRGPRVIKLHCLRGCNTINIDNHLLRGYSGPLECPRCGYLHLLEVGSDGTIMTFRAAHPL